MELSKTKVSLYSSLSTKKMRNKHGLFVAEGTKCVFDMFDAFDAEIIIATSDWIKSHPVLVSKISVPMAEVSQSIITKISSLSTPSSVLAVFHLPDYPKVEIRNNKLYLLLDGVQDPGNLGTIIRTADWFGVDTIFASSSTVDVFNPKCVQSTMGSLKRVKVVYTSLEELIKDNSELPVYGTVLDGDNIYDSSLENRGFLIMGNEGNGISDSIREMITSPLLIPPYNPTSHGESLNVAIATAIMLSRLRFG